MSRKVTANLPDAAVKALQEMAAERGSSMTEILRQAISTEKFLQDEMKDGAKILVQHKKKGTRELLLR